MDRTQSKLFVGYIEPSLDQKSKTPTDDQLTQFAMRVLQEAKKGVADYEDPENPTSEPIFRENDNWRGTHRTPCGNYSDSQDYKLLNGMFTNSLFPFYLRWYRNAFSETEMQKVRDLHDFYVRIGFIKGFIEGEPVEMFQETVKTAPDPEDKTKQVVRPVSFEEEHTVGMSDETTLPKNERPEKPNADFIIER